MGNQSKGPAILLGPEDGKSYWQPQPSRGYSTVKLSPENSPFDIFTSGIQVLEPGASVRKHGHEHNHEMIFVYAGTGRAEIDDVDYELEPECTILVGPYIQHYVENTGSTPLRMLWIIFPAGLEEWFASIGRPRTAGDALPEPFERPLDVKEIQARMKFVNPDSDTK